MAEPHIGLIGVGAIGHDVLQHLRARHPDMRFTVLRRTGGDADKSAGEKYVNTIEALTAARPDIVVEAAGHQAIATYVPALLRAGIPVVAASVGSLMSETETGWLGDDLQKLATAHQSLLILPPGAVGGLDYIASVAILPDLKIAYTSRKPPAAWADELALRGLKPADLTGALVLFEGSVAEAAALYPKNLNVAATIALAVGRADAVSVRVVVDPAARGNTHEIDCNSAAGVARFEFVNAPAASNPKTSMVTALSLVHCVEHYLATRPHQDS
jgi:aspartate dehydrogenase